MKEPHRDSGVEKYNIWSKNSQEGIDITFKLADERIS